MSEFRRDDTASWDAQEVRQAQGARREAASAHHSKSRPRRRRQNPLAVLVGYLIFVLLASAILAGMGWARISVPSTGVLCGRPRWR